MAISDGYQSGAVPSGDSNESNGKLPRSATATTVRFVPKSTPNFIPVSLATSAAACRPGGKNTSYVQQEHVDRRIRALAHRNGALAQRPGCQLPADIGNQSGQQCQRDHL